MSLKHEKMAALTLELVNPLFIITFHVFCLHIEVFHSAKATDFVESKVTVRMYQTIMCISLNCEYESVRCWPLMYHSSVESAILSSIHYSKMLQDTKTEKKGIKLQKVNVR